MTWMVDRSRSVAGHECKAKRYYQYHLYGKGIVPVAASMPLATGIAVHAGIANIIFTAHGTESLPTRDEAIYFAEMAAEDYVSNVRSNGFLDNAGRNDEEEKAENIRIMNEQAALIKALILGFYRTSLPPILEEHKIIAVEEEMEINLPFFDMKFMSRPDFITEHRLTGQLAVRDLKTTSTFGDEWARPWMDSIQMMGQALAAEKMLGRPVEQYYIDAIIKGQRKQDYNSATGKYDLGPRKQQSPLIYAYRKEACPPMQPDDLWEPFWNYIGKDGKKHTLGKGWEKAAVWEHANLEEWVLDVMSSGDVAQSFKQIGPFPVNRYKVEQWLRGMTAEEMRWKRDIQEQEDLQAELDAESGDLFSVAWEKKKFQDAIDVRFTRSYNCHSYGAQCPYYRLCFKQDGWEKPLSSGRYTLRTPHHETENDFNG